MPSSYVHSNGSPSDVATGQIAPVDRIFRAYGEGYAALLLTGRSLYDLVATENESLLTLQEHLRRHAQQRFGMHMLAYSLAGGMDWDSERITDERDRDTISTVLRTHGLLNVEPDENEVVRVMRGVASLARSRTRGLQWSDGRPLRFLILLEFVEHLTPCGDGVGRTDQELRAIELAHVLGQSNALRQSQNLIVFHGREGLVDDLVSGVLYPIRLPQPDAAEKRTFLSVAANIYPEVRFEGDVSIDEVARLTTNTPNRGLEARLRASHRRGTPVTVEELLEQKSRDVEMLSEQTLSVLDTRRIEGLRLVGRNVETPLRWLMTFGEGLRRGDSNIPANVILVGPPGTGKTDLALLAARTARASAYQVYSPKGSLVGETERKARLLTQALVEWTPNVAFVDEITEALPLQRSEFDGDSGASRAVTAALLTAMSDESRRGRSLLIATTNCPWRMGLAMRKRFTLIPVLSPLAEDYPAMICAVVTRMIPDARLDPESIIEAARLFFVKGASAREIRAELSLALIEEKELTPEVVLQAARDLRPEADRASAEYADLWAIRACTSERYFPWHGGADDYPFPPHLEGLVDPTTGDIDREALDARLEALKPRANL